MRDLIHLFAFLRSLTRDIPRVRLALLAIVGAGLASGFSSTGMIALASSIVSSSRPPSRALLGAFVALGLALPVFRLVSQGLLVDLTQKSLLSLRLQLSRKVLAAPLRRLETLGPHRVLATLTTDIQSILDGFAAVPILFMHAAILAGCFAYLGWLSPTLLLLTLGLLTVGILTYQLALGRALGYLRRARERLDEVFAQIRALTDGTKELKMHQGRQRAFLGRVEASGRSLLRENRAGFLLFTVASSWGQTFFFFVLGLLIFAVPKIEAVEPRVLIAYTIVLFQTMMPLEVLLNALPNLSRAAVAARAVEQLGSSLDSETPADAPAPAAVLPARWDRLELLGITHTYRRETEDESFLLGPIDLTLEAGEIVLFVGGNGSGKTTLAKLLIGLYAPESGEIRLQGTPVTAANRERYRQQFAVVFSDFFVFEELLGLDSPELDESARHYLRRLQLEQKVRLEAGRLSTVELSQGQRKRLALLTAYLEDRPVYLFDEWAADQDPLFKDIFYRDLLPGLKARGKTVFVITHDDHYFHLADRIVKLSDGRIESDSRPAGSRETAFEQGPVEARSGAL